MWRVKNKYDEAAKVSGGFRNIHFNLLLKQPGSEGARHGFLCELQVQHRDMWDMEQEGNAHDRYIQFRNDRAE